MIPVATMPQGYDQPQRLPEWDSSTCLAWHAYDKDTGRHLFIKQLRPELAASADHRTAFAKEYSIGCKLQSDYFPTYHKLDESNAGLFLTMDFIDGMSLGEFMASSPRYFHHKQNLIRLLHQLLQAMEAMHQADIVHLDLKPDNIFITHRTQSVRIIDFGYSCSGEWAKAAGMTRQFAAPEQLRGEQACIDARTDIYGFGKIVQEISWQTQCKLPRFLRKIADRCINEDPDKRYNTAREVLDEIDSHLARRRKQVAKVVALSVLTTCIVFALGFMGYRYYTQDEFSQDGLTYHIMPHQWVTDRFEDVVELTGRTEDAQLDSTFRIPNTVTFRGREYKVYQVGYNAFHHNSWIKKVVFPEELRFVGSYSFRFCSNLQEVELQQNVSYVDECAFGYCPALHSILVSCKNPYLCVEDGVLFRRDPYHLERCTTDKKGEYTVPQGVREISHSAFQGCSRLTHITLPEGVEKVRPFAFEDCTSLRSVDMPSSVVDIEMYIFGGCTQLQHVTLSPRTVILAQSTFDGCRSLRQITLPASLIRIGHRCFWNTDSLQTVVNLAAKPQEIADSTFSRYGDLYVPDEAVGVYRAAPYWQRFDIHPLRDYEEIAEHGTAELFSYK